jgi:hypothetical protein
MAKVPRVTHPEFVDFNSDEEDLFDEEEDDLLSYDVVANMFGKQEELLINAKSKHEALLVSLKHSSQNAKFMLMIIESF